MVGAGLAGLAAALRLGEAGRRVVIHEAARHAGGRCRSYFDRALGCRIDNGNHLLLSGNRSALDYLRRLGAEDGLTGSEQPAFPFVDLESGARWTVRPNLGRVPWWVLAPGRRVPGTRFGDYLAARRLARASAEATVAGCLDDGRALWRTFWDPLTRAVLNTPPASASARLLWATLVESFADGGAGCRPLVAREGLSEAFVDPALKRLPDLGAEVRFGRRLRAIEQVEGRIARLAFTDGEEILGDADALVLAAPAWQVAELLPEIRPPTAAHAIINGHFRLDRSLALPDGAVLLGLIGGTAEWLFVRGSVVSLTISAADHLADDDADELARRLWRDTARALDLPVEPLPPWRILKEKRATIAQTPAANRRRPDTRTRWANLVLAGDWTATGLPATIEGSIRSGDRAAARLERDQIQPPSQT